MVLIDQFLVTTMVMG